MAVFRGKASVRSNRAAVNPAMNQPRTLGAAPQASPQQPVAHSPAQQPIQSQDQARQYAVQQLQQMKSQAQSAPPSPDVSINQPQASRSQTPAPQVTQAPQMQQPQAMAQPQQPQAMAQPVQQVPTGPLQPPAAANPVQPPQTKGPEPPFVDQPKVVKKPKKGKKKLFIALIAGLLLLLGAGGGGVAAYALWYVPNLPQNVVAASLITTLDGYPLQSQATNVELQLYFDDMDEPINANVLMELNPDGTLAAEIGLENINGLMDASGLSQIVGADVGINDMNMTVAMDDVGTTYIKVDGLQPIANQADELSELFSGLISSQFSSASLTEEEQQELTQVLSAVEQSFAKMLRDMVSRMDNNWLSTPLANGDSFKETTCQIRTLLNSENYIEDEAASKALRDNYLDNQFVVAEDMGSTVLNGETMTEYAVQLKKQELTDFLRGIDLNQGGLEIKGLEACSSSGIDQPAQSTNSNSPIGQSDIDDLIADIEEIDEEDMKFNLWVDDQKRITRFQLEAVNDGEQSGVSGDPSESSLNSLTPEISRMVIDVSFDYSGGRGIVSDAASGSAKDLEAEFETLVTEFETDLRTSLGLESEEDVIFTPRIIIDDFFDA